MPMRTAVLAVLVAADIGLTPEEIAHNYNVNAEIVRQRLVELKENGHVKQEKGRYFSTDSVEPAIIADGEIEHFHA